MFPKRATAAASIRGRKKSIAEAAPVKASSKKSAASTPPSHLAKLPSEALPKTATNRSKHKLDIDAEQPTITAIKKRRGPNTSPSSPIPSSRKKSIAQPKYAFPGARKIQAQDGETPLTHAPAKRLNVYVFGGNSAGELGLGVEEGPENVARPRLNLNLAAASTGVVQLAAGGMHCAALTYDNKIFTWGVNDLGALGRDTTWEGGLVDMKNDDSDTDSESGLNPRECTPTEVDTSGIPEETIFTQLAAGDNATLALTNKGLVYGWGTFRSNDGVLGFSQTQKIQKRPSHLPGLKRITKIVIGNNHALALTSNGSVFIWGSGEQSQLGRRIVDRTKLSGLVPRQHGLLRNIVDIGAGSDHSFAIDKNGKVYSWGLNNYGQTGIVENAGEHEAVTLAPTVVESLKNYSRVTCITGGNHHSIAVTDQGECLVWGRLDSYAAGLKLDSLSSENVIRDSRHKPSILKVPVRVPGFDAAFVAAGSDHSIAITKDHKAFSWGFNVDSQTGQETDDDEVECATLIDYAAIREKKLVWAGTGGQFSILAGEYH